MTDFNSVVEICKGLYLTDSPQDRAALDNLRYIQEHKHCDKLTFGSTIHTDKMISKRDGVLHVKTIKTEMFYIRVSLFSTVIYTAETTMRGAINEAREKFDRHVKRVEEGLNE